MGNLFFSINELTDYLISKETQHTKMNIDLPAGVQFEAYLEALTGKAFSAKDNCLLGETFLTADFARDILLSKRH